MNAFKISSCGIVLGLAAVLGFGLPAQAEVATGTWTTNTWSTFTASANNIVRPGYLAPGSPYTDFRFCDGCSDNPTFGGNCSVTWNFPRKATIRGLKLYSQWKDTGRDDIRITAMKVKHTADGEWETVPGTQLTFTHSSTYQKKLFAHFAAAGDAPIAEDVVAVQLVYPGQESGYIGFNESEVLGELEPTSEPEFVSDYVWTAGGYTASTWTALGSSNMMAYCSSILLTTSQGTSVTTDYNQITDGFVARYNKHIGSDTSLTWLYAQPFDLYSFSIFSRWNDAGRDSVSIWKFETQDEAGNWTVHTDYENWCMVGTGQNIDTNKTTTGANYATLRRKDGAPIATGVKGVRVFTYYGDQACWAEAEAEGCMAKGAAIFDERSVTVTNDCWTVNWSAKVASLGASDVATVKLWTSFDNVNFTLADTVDVTEENVPVAFSKTYDDINQKIYYKFETINSKGAQEWRSTNETASVVNYDNAVYYWKPSVANGVWEDAVNWSNSHNDVRLAWPTHQYATADFSLLDADHPATVTVGASHNPKLVLAPNESAAHVTFKGETSVTLDFNALAPKMTGIVEADGLGFRTPGVIFADGARFIGRNGATCYMYLFQVTGSRSRLELYSGATLSSSWSYSYVGNDSEIILDGGTMSPTYFIWSSTKDPHPGYIVFGPNGGGFTTTHGHNQENGGTCEFRYQLPSDGWKGREAAPLRVKRVNYMHQFGNGGNWRVNVQAATMPRKVLEVKLIDMYDKDTIKTNDFAFSAFGTTLKINETNKRGDYFYWTYNGTEQTVPETAGALPTGLRLHYAGAKGMILLVR